MVEPDARLSAAGTHDLVLPATATAWRALTPRQRSAHIRCLRYEIVRRQDDVVAAITADTGKPAFEALAQEITPALEVMRYAGRNLPRWLRARHFWYPRPGFWGKIGQVIYEPLGTVAIIGPANFPFSLPLMQTVYALLCGNSVLLKPSERAPACTSLLKALFRETGLPVMVIEGGPPEAQRLIEDPDVKKVFFTGSPQAGREVAALCGAYFKPCVLELGGCGHAIVCDDAHVESAVSGLVWSAFYSGGRSCVGTRCVWVEAGIWEPFLRHLEEELQHLQPSDLASALHDLPDAEGYPSEEVASYELGSGARLLQASTSGDTLSGRTPTVLALEAPGLEKLPSGPHLLTAVCVPFAQRAIAAVNASDSVLGASIWTRSPARARAIAARLDAGLVWINDASAGQPQLPWGGSGSCGWGRVFSRHVVTEFVHVKAVTHELRSGHRQSWWFPYSERRANLLRVLNRRIYGSTSRRSAFRR